MKFRVLESDFYRLKRIASELPTWPPCSDCLATAVAENASAP